MPKKKPKEENAPLIKSEVNIEAKGEAKDLLGLGQVAKSKAGRDMLGKVGIAIGYAIETSTTALVGRRAGRALADSAVAMAEAKRQVALIEAQTRQEIEAIEAQPQPAIRMRSGLRVLAEANREQAYIEGTTAEAFERAEQRNDPDPVPLDEEFVLSWLESVKGNHHADVRKLLAAVLDNQTRSDASKVSGPSMQLMRHLDGKLAQGFAKLCSNLLNYGSYPMDGAGIYPTGDHAIDYQSIALLEETGFIKLHQMQFFQFGECELRLYAQKFSPAHQQYLLTVRGRELAHAFYGPLPLSEGLADRIPTNQEATDYYVSLIKSVAAYWEDGAEIRFTKDGKSVSLLFVMKPGESPQKFLGLRPIIKKDDILGLPGLLSEIGASASPLMLQVLNSAHEACDGCYYIATPT